MIREGTQRRVVDATFAIQQGSAPALLWRVQALAELLLQVQEFPQGPSPLAGRDLSTLENVSDVGLESRRQIGVHFQPQ